MKGCLSSLQVMSYLILPTILQLSLSDEETETQIGNILSEWSIQCCQSHGEALHPVPASGPAWEFPLGGRLGPSADFLCGLRQITCPLWTSVSPL